MTGPRLVLALLALLGLLALGDLRVHPHPVLGPEALPGGSAVLGLLGAGLLLLVSTALRLALRRPGGGDRGGADAGEPGPGGEGRPDPAAAGLPEVPDA